MSMTGYPDCGRNTPRNTPTYASLESQWQNFDVLPH